MPVKSYLGEDIKKLLLLIVLHIKTHPQVGGEIKHGVPQDCILGFLFFLIYVTELPALLKRNTKSFLYTDDTTRTVNSPKPYNYQIIVEDMFCNINKWFKDNLLSLNLEKNSLAF